MQVAQKLGSFFYTYTQCTKFSFNFLFQGNGFPFFLLILFFFLCEKYRYLSMGDKVERTSPFQIYYIHLRVGGRGEKTPSFDLINLTAVRGCSYAEVRTNEQARSDASNACPLHLLCKCGVPARGGVWFNNTLPSSPI